jgi:hypothetical protein
MRQNPDESTPLSVEDEAFVERLSEGFAPAPLCRARSAAFDDALASRIARPRRSRLIAPVLATAVAAAAVAWFVAPAALDPAPIGSGAAVVSEAAARWERELFDPAALIGPEDAGDAEQLPDDYAAIAAVFLDG